MSSQLPQVFVEFINKFPYSRQDALSAIAGTNTPYTAVAEAYAIHVDDPARSRDELIKITDVPDDLIPWKFLWLGTVHALLGQIKEAEQCFALAIEATPEDRLKGRIYVNWAGCLLEMNKDDDPAMAARAVDIIENGLKIVGAQDATGVILTANLGLAYKIMGRYDEAVQLFEHVRDFNEKRGAQLYTALATSDIADIYRRSQRINLAVKYALNAWGIIKDLDTIVNDKIGILRILIGILREAGDPDEALQYASIAIELAESARSQVETEKDRIDYFAILRSCYDEAILCRLAIGDPARAFDMTERGRARTLADLSGATSITVAELQLPKDLAILSYYVVNGDLFAFVLNENRVTVRQLGTLADIERTFDSTGYPRHLLPGAGGKLQNPWMLERVSNQIARPVDDLIADCERLCVIPYGPLHHLPLGTMFANRLVFRAPSVTVLIRHSQNPRSGLTAVAFGHNGDRLNHAEAEAQAIGAVAYTGPAATRQAVFDHAPRARWLHFSTHGYFDPTDPAKSYIDLVDGPLYASEITTRLRLSADLVVLSACDSGRNRIAPGDEPMGLIRAFMAAGAGCVVCTLWPVDEVATRLLMEYFYSNLRAGMRTAQALHMAQQRLRQITRLELPRELARPGLPKGKAREIETATSYDDLPFAHPFWWAGFTLVGDRLVA